MNDSLRAAISGTTGFVASVATTDAVSYGPLQISEFSTAAVQVLIGIFTLIGIIKGWRSPKIK